MARSTSPAFHWMIPMLKCASANEGFLGNGCLKFCKAKPFASDVISKYESKHEVGFRKVRLQPESFFQRSFGPLQVSPQPKRDAEPVLGFSDSRLQLHGRFKFGKRAACISAVEVRLPEPHVVVETRRLLRKCRTREQHEDCPRVPH